MDIREHYTKLGSTILTILDSSLDNENLDLFALNHCFIDDFGKMISFLEKRPEYHIFENAIKEYQISILSSILGLYQQSFMSLRFFLERTLVAVLFSANEMELNLWKVGQRDTYWNELIDKEKGVFSSKFCTAFFPELKDEIERFRSITCKVYRECSEYVHANQHVISNIPKSIEFSEYMFNEWNLKTEVIRRIILFVFCLRYLKYLDSTSLSSISSIILDELNSIKKIREIIA